MSPHPTAEPATDRDARREAVRRACGRIAPVWPLESFVAVNPYLGMAELTLSEAARRLAQVAGAQTSMPAAHYLDALQAGRIALEDVAEALAADPGCPFASVDQVIATARRSDAGPTEPTVPTVARVAGDLGGRDWSHLAGDRVSAWAAAHFDAGQAIWRSTSRDLGPFASWRAEALVDRTVDVMGLRRFRAAVAASPVDHGEALEAGLDRLGVSGDEAELYLHRLMMEVGGWSAHAARIVWDAGLAGHHDDTLEQFLAVLVTWEAALLDAVEDPRLAGAWREALGTIGTDGSSPEPGVTARAMLQEAADRAEQRRLITEMDAHAAGLTLNSATANKANVDAETASATRSTGASPGSPEVTGPGRAQAVFCIDVRSEVLRRHVEAVSPHVATVGFAGFFGFPIEYVPLGHRSGGAQCPVLLTPSHVVGESTTDERRLDDALETRRRAHLVRRAWKSFKMGAVSCFSFVGPVGLIYLPKLVTDSLGRTRPVARAETEALAAWAQAARGPDLSGRRPDALTAPEAPRTDQPGAPSAEAAMDRIMDDVADAAWGIPPADRIDLAEGALRAMSLTEGLARLVLITGHGPSTVNNPYDSGLACGACGGRTGEVNARVAAAVLNDPEVRAGLAERGIDVGDDTTFVACQHDTTTDDVTVFDRHLVPAGHATDLAATEADLAEAGRRARRERAGRLGIDPAGDVDAEVRRRSDHWAQVRPEWGLAGCRTFVVAPRARTEGLDLGGRAFLHSYEWRADVGFGVLELVMTAPMVVASWISLQYFASTVDNDVFGSGNKTLHNVVGRTGVLEGNGGDLRVGLPWQSVHDGVAFQHEPLRLNVVIEAPIEAMTDVLSRHDGVRELCDHRWVQLLAMDDGGRIAHRYVGDLSWRAIDPASTSDRPAEAAS